jgi:hypothetical protein
MFFYPAGNEKSMKTRWIVDAFLGRGQGGGLFAMKTESRKHERRKHETQKEVGRRETHGFHFVFFVFRITVPLDFFASRDEILSHGRTRNNTEKGKKEKLRLNFFRVIPCLSVAEMYFLAVASWPGYVFVIRKVDMTRS